MTPSPRDEIADVLVRYATSIDRRDWPLLRSCFTDDCEAEYGDIGSWRGADALAAWMEAAHAGCGHTLHRITNAVIAPSGDTANARSYVDAIVMGGDNRRGIQAVGRYDDELARSDEGWKIARRTFTLVLLRDVVDLRSGATDDVEAIKQVKARYFRTIDTKDWDALRELFTDDVVMDTTASGGGVLNGADAVIDFLRETIGAVVTVHHGHTPEIVPTSPVTATGTWAMEDMLRWPNGTELHGYGHYHETYVKTDGAWRIETLTLTRLRMDFTEPGADRPE